MIKLDFRRTINELIFNLKDHFCRFKKMYILFLLLMLVGIATGMLTAFKYTGEITIKHLNDNVLVGFLEDKVGAFGLLFKRVFAFCILFFIIIVINIKKFTCFLNFFLILYESYLLGLNCAIFILLFNISGIINVFLVYLPCHLIALITLMGLSTIFCSSCFKLSKYKENIFSQFFWQQNSRAIIFFLSISLISFLLEMILLPSFCSAFFIV